jgi:hypothetical protein
MSLELRENGVGGLMITALSQECVCWRDKIRPLSPVCRKIGVCVATICEEKTESNRKQM